MHEITITSLLIAGLLNEFCSALLFLINLCVSCHIRGFVRLISDHVNETWSEGPGIQMHMNSHLLNQRLYECQS